MYRDNEPARSTNRGSQKGKNVLDNGKKGRITVKQEQDRGQDYISRSRARSRDGSWEGQSSLHPGHMKGPLDGTGTSINAMMLHGVYAAEAVDDNHGTTNPRMIKTMDPTSTGI